MRIKRLANKNMKELFEKVENYCEPASAFTIVWGKKGLGWGQLYFYIGEDRLVHCDNELMSKDFIKKMLCEMVDNMKLDDPPSVVYRGPKGTDE